MKGMEEMPRHARTSNRSEPSAIAPSAFSKSMPKIETNDMAVGEEGGNAAMVFATRTTPAGNKYQKRLGAKKGEED